MSKKKKVKREMFSKLYHSPAITSQNLTLKKSYLDIDNTHNFEICQ